MRRLLAVLLLTVPLSGPALAADDDDDDIDLLEDDLDLLEDSNEPDDEGRLETGDDLQLDDEEDELDALEPLEDLDGEDLLDGDVTDEGGASDSALIYRQQMEQVELFDADEEVIAWERYLERYPDTEFRPRIQRRIDELMEAIYSERIGGVIGGPDADTQEILFAQGLLLENINPRSRVYGGFEWGLPNYMNLYGGYERQLWREFSVHGGIRRRYTGWNIEAGVRYALVKSQRTQTLVTVIGDVHLNSGPAFLGFRPQIGVGKIFGEKVHAQVQFGVDLETRDVTAPRLVYGANVTWLASSSVALFAESSGNMKHMFFKEADPFRFQVFSFGLKFLPSSSAIDQGALEANVGASAPYASAYWMYHFGSIMGQVNYYHP